MSASLPITFLTGSVLYVLQITSALEEVQSNLHVDGSGGVARQEGNAS